MGASAFSVQRQPTVIPGQTGAQGATGATGATGPGVPVSGAAGSVLTKNTSTDFDAAWATRATLAADAAFTAAFVAVPTAWTAVTFTNSWVNFGGAYNVCQYRKEGDVVQLRGMMSTGSFAAAFTLPVGFRPPADLYFPTVSNNLFGSFILQANGVFLPSAGSATWFSINCSFSVT